MGTGNTDGIGNSSASVTVHPRGHGEHGTPLFIKTTVFGSSPWTRGTLFTTRIDRYRMRFIPVDTGNTSKLLIVKVIHTVHPRGHGEHETAERATTFPVGSSPWTRGTLIKHHIFIYMARFIPVDTGNTADSWLFTSMLTVHPRGHGEHITRLACNNHVNGSSPWTRGTRDNTNRVSAKSRFIPVDTGNTTGVKLDQSAMAVHPRGHGEHGIYSRSCIANNGSSPWTRGTPCRLIDTVNH